jgi:hypothetical protein
VRLRYNKNITPWRRMGKWRYSSAILNLALDGWVVSFTPMPRYSQENSSRHPLLDRRPDGLKRRFGRYGTKILFPLPGIETRFLGCPTSSLVAILTALSRLAKAIKNVQHQCGMQNSTARIWQKGYDYTAQIGTRFQPDSTGAKKTIWCSNEFGCNMQQILPPNLDSLFSVPTGW